MNTELEAAFNGCQCISCRQERMRLAPEIADAFYAYTKALENWNKRKVVPISEARQRRGDRL